MGGTDHATERRPRPSGTAAGVRLALDIGGTKTGALALDSAGAVLARGRVPTRAGPEDVVSSAEAAFAAMQAELEPAAGVSRSLGVGTPGSAGASAFVASLDLSARVELVDADAPVAAMGAALLGADEEALWPR